MTVWYRSQPVGILTPNQQGGFLFSYADDWMQREVSFPISLSMPLSESVDQDRADAFFSNLLPEGPERSGFAGSWVSLSTTPSRGLSGARFGAL